MKSNYRPWFIKRAQSWEYNVVPLDNFMIALAEGEILQGYRTPHPSDHLDFYKGYYYWAPSTRDRKLGRVIPGTFARLM